MEPGMLSGVLDPYFYSRMRANMNLRDPMHAIVAPLEHREFAREVVGRNPLMAGPVAAGIPLWVLAKYLNFIPKGPNTSPASLDEIFAGYEGMLGGLKDYATNK